MGHAVAMILTIPMILLAWRVLRDHEGPIPVNLQHLEEGMVPVGVADVYRFGDLQLNCHGPGLDPTPGTAPRCGSGPWFPRGGDWHRVDRCWRGLAIVTELTARALSRSTSSPKRASRFLDVQRMPDLHLGDAVVLGKLGQQQPAETGPLLAHK